MDQVNPKFAQQLRDNEKAYPCCRAQKGMTASFYQTATAEGNADLMIATCGDCGRKHYRIAANPIGNFQKRSLKGHYP